VRLELVPFGEPAQLLGDTAVAAVGGVAAFNVSITVASVFGIRAHSGSLDTATAVVTVQSASPRLVRFRR